MLGKDAIEAIIAEHDKAPQKRILQRRLADESVRIIHGDERLNTIPFDAGCTIWRRESRRIT